MDDLLDAVDDDFCYLTTRGRRTGRQPEIEISFALDARTIYLLSGGGEASDWVRNLRADSAVAVRLRDTTFDGDARVVDEGEDSDRGRTLVFDKYQPRYGGGAQRGGAETLAHT